MRARLSVLTVVLLLLTGCSGGEDEDEANAEGAADDLAASLEAGDFADLELAGSTSKEVKKDYAATVEGMGGLEPTVSAAGAEVAEDGDTATVTLAWSWPVADEQEWAYETEAELTGSGSDWAVTWSRSIVEPSLTDTSVLDADHHRLGPRRHHRRGRPEAIVTTRPVVEVGVDKSRVAASAGAALAEQVADVTGIDAAPTSSRSRPPATRRSSRRSPTASTTSRGAVHAWPTASDGVLR